MKKILFGAAFLASFGSADIEQCSRANCDSEWQTCGQRTKCQSILRSCLNKCKGNQACWVNCLSTFNNDDSNAVAICSQSSGCLQNDIPSILDTQQCAENYCPNEWDVCAKSSKCPNVLLSCLSKCSQDQACWVNCLKNKRIKSAFNVAKCAFSNSCLLAEDQFPEPAPTPTPKINLPFSSNKPSVLQQCAQQKCPQNWSSCSGSSNCINNLLACQKKCQENQPCWIQCLSPAGSNQIGVALCAQSRGCIKTSGAKSPVGKTQQCAQKKCNNQWNNCLNDSKCLPTLFECFNKCGTQVFCWLGCLPSKGSSSAFSVALCAQSNGCI